MEEDLTPTAENLSATLPQDTKKLVIERNKETTEKQLTTIMDGCRTEELQRICSLSSWDNALEYLKQELNSYTTRTGKKIVKDDGKYKEMMQSLSNFKYHLEILLEERISNEKLFEGHGWFCDSNDGRIFTSLKVEVSNSKDVYDYFDKNGAKFTELPPILTLDLARFQVDDKNTMVKVNDRFEYPLKLDLEKYVSPSSAQTSIRNVYLLHTVVVHSGGVKDREYSALLSPTLSNFWINLDSKKRVHVQRAIDEQFGGNEECPPLLFKEACNALILVYIREKGKENLISKLDLDEKEIVILDEENEDSCVIIKVARKDDLSEEIGGEDEVCFQIEKNIIFRKFEDEVAEYFGVPTHRLRLYSSQSPQSLIRSKRQLKTVKEIVGDEDEVKLFLQFDILPGATGVCASCPGTINKRLEEFGISDLEDLGK